EQMGQQQPWLDVERARLAVDGDGHPSDRYAGLLGGRDLFEEARHGQAASVVGVETRFRIRVTNVWTTWRLYSALPRWSERGSAAWAARSAARVIAASSSVWPASDSAASRASIVREPTPLRAIPARMTRSPSSSTATALPAVAKSPT